jgi:glycerophosphoryl diester phosphodiesterase
MKERLVAHRGNAAEFKENSIDALESAIEFGLSYVEFDVQMSSDGVPHLIHDSSLRRLYDLDRDTSDSTAAFLQDLGIATLEQAVGVIRNHEVTAFVDLKVDSLDRFGRELVVSAVCEKLTASCVVISFDHDALALARNRGFRIGLILRDTNEQTRTQVEALTPDYVFCDHRKIANQVWAGPIWVAYEVAEHRTARRLLGFGVTLLETMSVRKMSMLQ